VRTLPVLATALVALAAALAVSACGGPEETVAAPYKTVPITPFLGDAVMGDPKAPVEIVEYASTTCSHCSAFHREVLPELKTRYIDTGKARLRWMVMPTPPPEISVAGAALARCAGEAKFFDVIADLFDAQDALIKAAPHPRRLQQAFIDIGRRHGLSSDEVGTCIADPAVFAVIRKEAEEAPVTVTGTPTFFVNGQQIDENSADAIAAVIDAELAQPVN
jgi:protein-disulfide isomerase